MSQKKDFRQFGELLNKGWKIKRELSSKITNSKIDTIYEKALDNGAIGGKLLGAGGGGFILFYVEPENHESVKTALTDCLHVPFRFDFSGSHVLSKPRFSDRGSNDRSDSNT